MAYYMNKSVPAKRGDIFYISNSNNKKYQSEVARLNTEKNKARDSVYNLIIEKIQYEVGHRLSRKKAEAIWNRAYEDGHSFGFYEIRCRLSDLIDLAITLLGGDK